VLQFAAVSPGMAAAGSRVAMPGLIPERGSSSQSARHRGHDSSIPSQIKVPPGQQVAAANKSSLVEGSKSGSAGPSKAPSERSGKSTPRNDVGKMRASRGLDPGHIEGMKRIRQQDYTAAIEALEGAKQKLFPREANTYPAVTEGTPPSTSASSLQMHLPSIDPPTYTSSTLGEIDGFSDVTSVCSLDRRTEAGAESVKSLDSRTNSHQRRRAAANTQQPTKIHKARLCADMCLVYSRLRQWEKADEAAADPPECSLVLRTKLEYQTSVLDLTRMHGYDSCCDEALPVPI